MTDSQAVGKAVFVLGLAILLTTLLYGNANPAWNRLQTDLQTGPPPFVNPFANTVVDTMPVVANGSVFNAGVWFPEPPQGEVGCSLADYWTCLQTPDADTSYVQLNGIAPHVAVNMSGLQGGGSLNVVAYFYFTYQCRVASSPAQMEFFLYKPDTTLLFDVAKPDACTTTTGWENDTALFSLDSAETLGDFTQLTLYIGATSAMDLSFINLNVAYRHANACPGGLDGIACGITNLFQGFFDGIFFLINGAIWIGGVAFWLGTLAFDFFSGIIGGFVWLLTLPGEPPFIAAIMAAMIFGVIAFVALVVIKTLRGSYP